jgi:4-diphosphocytidyl-2-C-methyl-D-erythritol kinase
VRAPGKVNLCLLVGAPRPDGLHPLVSLVQPTDLADVLEVKGNVKGTVPFMFDEVVCAGVDGENLALRALREFRAATGWDGPPLRIEITKRIPIAAGMAGGSSDAAAALRIISEVSGIAVPGDVPMRLGADVTVMLRGERALMTGAGEFVEPLPGAKPPLIVVPLDAALGAGEVYREFDSSDTPRTPEELDTAAQALRDGVFDYVNDLEPAARRLCPLIDPALQALRDVGAEHVMVTGSGPTVFGLSDDPEALAFLQRTYPRATVA